MSVLEKILTWSASRPSWQRDALRRLLQQDELAQNDVAELTQICLAAHGIADDAKPAIAAAPLSRDHIGAGGGIGMRVRLTGVRDVQRVNALAPGRTLSFEASGLTVIYGDNGSGKSGYTRILKTVCRARGGVPKIHPNIFVEPTDCSPTAQIGYLLDDAPVTHTWIDGTTGPGELGSISVFDTSCASVYVENKTDVAFRPFGLDLFPRLVSACERVKASINASIAAQGATRMFPDLTGETKVGQFMRSLGSKNAGPSLEKLSALTEKELTRLTELKQLVAELNANDPRRRAAEVRLQAARFRVFLKHAESSERLLAAEATEAIRRAHTDMLATAEAARLASGAAFESEPLRGVGSEPWYSLWSAARRFSEQEAYPGQTFPVTAGDAACVLCHQPLHPFASDRLSRFEAFVRQEAREAHSRSAKAFQILLEPLRELSVVRESDENVLEELLAHDPALCAAFKSYLNQMQRRLAELREACLSGAWEGITPNGESPCGRLLLLISALEQTVLQLDQAGEPEGVAAIRREYAELLDREKLSKIKNEVQAEIARQQRVNALKAALKDTDTTGITTKNTELTKTEVTDGLRQRFAQEHKELDLRHLTVTVAPEHGTKGVMFHRIAFDDAKTKGWGVQEVLSEGEHRCIALASFLAELSTQSVASTIILDDPVTSLDHSRREFVARRLVREAKNRPVIVLTHDIVFLLFLQEQAEAQQVKFAGRFLDREKGALGVPIEGLPWYGMPLKKRIGWLRQQVVDLRKTHVEESRETYDRDCSYLWGRLREAWECGVEEVLLNGAIKRFSRKVSTQPLRTVHDITPADIAAVEEGMSACSTWLPGHDQAAALNTAMPDPDVIHDRIEALELWREGIVTRRQKQKAS